MTDGERILHANEISFEYRAGQPVLRSVTLAATAGRLLCILGPNGSGKTTLLKCLLGVLKPTSGRVLLDGKAVGDYSPGGLARMMAYVPQVASSAFAFSVRELVMMGRFAHTGSMGLAVDRDRAIADEAMKMTDTLRFADRLLSELSGGEAQRVMIARALAQQPRVCALDEPTSHLDIKNQLTIYRMMVRLAHDWRMAVVCVSHDVNLAGRFADELMVMRDGRVLAAGSPGEVVNRQVLQDAYGVAVDLVDVVDGPVPMVRAL